MPKTVNKAPAPKPKVVSGGKKKVSKPMTFLFIALALFGVTLVSAVGYNKWKESDLKAKAAGWKTVAYDSGISVAVCKTYNSAYGGIYTVKALYTKAASTPAKRYQMQTVRPPSLTQVSYSSGTAFWSNTVASISVNASIALNDWVSISIGDGYADAYINNSQATNNYSWTQIPFC